MKMDGSSMGSMSSMAPMSSMGSMHSMGSMGSMGSMTSMAMASGSSMPSGDSMGSMDHHMGSMGMSMHVYLTTNYKDYPVLFRGLHASNGGEAFGIFLLLFFIGVLVRGIEFLRTYLEQVVWKNPTYVSCHPSGTIRGADPAILCSDTNQIDEGNCCGGNKDAVYDAAADKGESADTFTHRIDSDQQQHTKLPLASMVVRSVIRLALCILPELFILALMLAAMSFAIVYFFAVALGLGIGKFMFDMITDAIQIKPVGRSGVHV
ncbi:Piso0_002351 [Millerozyma farinosa CBS 7064]|uniref:Copper transport protein n=1 Tax=Pichia sorbitophila (strain ATCC MYA-4447 / BCRC 22081 / CBS 7064 / NBRC 10061 / NRRL Y-12695) TaxID=559304 RepID=G8YET9_PICSO|nr:Piso0_002351 [Millerozyma farinosa CBS 7064]